MPDAPSPVTWSPVELRRAVAVLVIAHGVATAVLYRAPEPLPGTFLAVSTLLLIVTVGAWPPRRPLGLRADSLSAPISGATLGLAGFQLLLAATMVVAVALFAPEPQGDMTLAEVGRGWDLDTSLRVLEVAVVAPVAEETAWRGLLLGALLKRVKTVPGAWAAAFISGAGFSLTHLVYQPQSLGVLFTFVIIGTVWGMVAYIDGHIWRAILLHAVLNAWALLPSLFPPRVGLALGAALILLGLPAVPAAYRFLKTATRRAEPEREPAVDA